MKSNCSFNSPVIIDTDAEVRWIGTGGVKDLISTFFENRVYAGTGTKLTRMELDGAHSVIADYSGSGVRSLHHNADYGKNGILLEINTSAWEESITMEVDASGTILKMWNLADILSAAMTAGGDDPSQFVQPAPTDWFHENAAAYRKSDNTLIVSSRENFVIGIDYDTSAIKWILGDPTNGINSSP